MPPKTVEVRMRSEYRRVDVIPAPCRKGIPHGGHLWLPYFSNAHSQYLPVEAIRYCPGERAQKQESVQ